MYFQPYEKSICYIIVINRKNSISQLPKIGYGSSALDGGHLIFSTIEKNQLLNNIPQAEKYFKKLIGSQELIKGIERWCLWINDEDLDEAKQIEFIANRLEKVRDFRLQSKRQATIDAAMTPYKFGEPRYIKGNVIIIPKVSSESRHYLPVGFAFDVVILDKAFPIYQSELYVFSVISSKLHLLWLQSIGGRLETRLSYSSSIVYNTFPFPSITDKQKEMLKTHTINVISARERDSGKTLAQLYDPDKMPDQLREAHHQLDLAVEGCYRNKPFESDEERLEYLFKLYEEMIKGRND